MQSRKNKRDRFRDSVTAVWTVLMPVLSLRYDKYAYYSQDKNVLIKFVLTI